MSGTATAWSPTGAQQAAPTSRRMSMLSVKLSLGVATVLTTFTMTSISFADEPAHPTTTGGSSSVSTSTVTTPSSPTVPTTSTTVTTQGATPQTGTDPAASTTTTTGADTDPSLAPPTTPP